MRQFIHLILQCFFIYFFLSFKQFYRFIIWLDFFLLLFFSVEQANLNFMTFSMTSRVICETDVMWSIKHKIRNNQAAKQSEKETGRNEIYIHKFYCFVWFFFSLLCCFQWKDSWRTTNTVLKWQLRNIDAKQSHYINVTEIQNRKTLQSLIYTYTFI